MITTILTSPIVIGLIAGIIVYLIMYYRACSAENEALKKNKEINKNDYKVSLTIPIIISIIVIGGMFWYDSNIPRLESPTIINNNYEMTDVFHDLYH